MSETEARFYELMVIISGELTEKEFEKELDDVRAMLKEASTHIDYEESWGKRDLAFKIKRQARGYYVIFDFHAMPEAIKELSTSVRLHPTVLRHLLIQNADDYNPTAYKEAMVRRRKLDEEEESREKQPKKEVVHVAAPVVESDAEEKAPKKPKKSVDDIVSNPDIQM